MFLKVVERNNLHWFRLTKPGSKEERMLVGFSFPTVNTDQIQLNSALYTTVREEGVDAAK